MERFFKLGIFVILLLSLSILVYKGCGSKKQKMHTENFFFLDNFVVDNEDQAIDLALQQSTDLLKTTSAMLGAYYNLEMLTAFQKYNLRLNSDLEWAFTEYKGFLEGTFFYYYNALLNMQLAKRTEAIDNIDEFLTHYHRTDALRSLAKDYKSLLQRQLSITQFWDKNKNKQEIRPLVMASIQAIDKNVLKKLLNNTHPADHSLAYLVKQAEKGDISAWRTYRSNAELFKPLYTETIILKKKGPQAGKALSFDKPFYYPYEYDILIKLYTIVLKRLTASYLSQNPRQIFSEADSVGKTQFFYFNLHLSDMYKFGLSRQSHLLLEQTRLMARTPLQRALVEVNQNIIDARLNGQKKIKIQSLPADYIPYLKALFNAYQFRNMAQAGFAIDKKEIEQCKADIYAYAPDENYTLHGLGYLGEVYLELGQWKNAMVYLNYLVQNGYTLQSNDPINLSELALAIYNERSQMSECNWILKNLREKYSYVNPLFQNTKFIVSAKFSK